MIKSFQVTHRAQNPAQFKALRELLNALGAEQGFAGENEFWRTAAFNSSSLRFEIALQSKKTSKHRPYSDIHLLLYVTDPDSALDQLRKKRFKVVQEHSAGGVEASVGSFIVVLPGDLKVWVMGQRALESTDLDHVGTEGKLDAGGRRFGIVVSRFNSFITERLVSGSLDALLRTGAKRADIKVVRVPGSFEIPSAARMLAETGMVDAIICLGCLLRGETANYDQICAEVTRGVGQSAQETGVPHAWGVLTCDTLEQAIDRAGLKSGNKGFEAALAAVEMASLGKVLSTQYAVPGDKGKVKISAKQSTAKRGKKR